MMQTTQVEEISSPPLQKPKRRIAWKRIIGLVLVFLVSAASTFGYMEYRSLSGNVFVAGGKSDKGLLAYGSGKTSAVDTSSLVKAGDGRYNLLLLGIGGVADDGVAHDGTDLTDSIQVLSFDTVNKTVSMTSVPRDFLVDIPGHGYNKINAVYEYGESDSNNGAQGGGAAAMKEFGNLLGISISNFAVIDFTAAQDIVDTVGGIDVDVPTSLYDPTFPCADQIHYCPFSITAGEQHMNGTVALEYMRTRHDDNDFARSARQQLVLSAIKQKALTVGVLTNPVKVIDIINSLGSHVKTDLTPSQIESLVTEFRSIPSSSITSNTLETGASENLLIGTTNPYAGDVEEPVGGLTAYGPIQEWFQKNNPDPFIAKENASITVVNNGGSTTQFQTFLTKLKDYGFNAQTSNVLPSTTYTSTQLFEKSATSKPIMHNYLQSLLGVSAKSGDPLSSNSDFDIIYVP